jgi:uncharacterized membrane-anchored protein
MHTLNSNLNTIVSKVPQVTLAFWIIKILATTLGEIGGDAVTMSWLGETTSRSAAFGTVSETQSAMQSTTRSFAVAHTML